MSDKIEGVSIAASSNGKLRAPTITVVTENQRPEATPRFSEPSSSHPPQLYSEPFLLTDRAESYNDGERRVHLSDPSGQINNVTDNLLDVPSTARHIRSQSWSSDGSYSSNWTTSPHPTTPASDVGDPHIDTRRLLSTDPPEDSPGSPFAFTVNQLAKLHDPKDLNTLRAMAGLEGLCLGLRTDKTRGLSRDEDVLDGHVTLEDVQHMLEAQKTAATSSLVDYQPRQSSTETYVDQPEPPVPGLLSRRSTLLSLNFRRGEQPFRDRKKAFGENRIPVRKAKNIFQLMWMALQDKVLILLCVAAVISLALGLYQSFRPGSTNELEWIEGVAILVAVAIATIAQSINDYQKERQFRRLNLKKEDRNIKVVRGGRPGLTSIYDVVVGDILILEPGDIVPVDAILTEGYGIRCDESSITGESHALKKVPADIALDNTSVGAQSTDSYDPFILSGSKVSEGVGRSLVTAVGPHSCYGRTMIALREDPEDTPLQIKLNRIADMIAKWGTAIAFLLFIILFIKFLVRLSIVSESPSQQAEHFIQLVIVAVSVVVLAVPEGLPLAVTLSLAYATVRMLKDNNLVRVLKACETMGNVTTICCDKTGTLTENKMTVVVGTMGVSDQFVRKSLPVIDAVSLQQNDAEAEMGGADAIPMPTYFAAMPDEIRTLLRQSIAVNSTAFEGVDEQGNKTFIGSKTETALLDMANDYLGMDDVATERENANVVQPIPFSSERKWMGTVVKMETGGHIFHRLFVKGGVEIVLKSSNRVIDFTNSNELARDLSDEDIRIINGTNREYASRTLRTIALAYRDFEQWPPKGARVSRSDNTIVEIGDLFKNLGFISIVGIMDPLRPGVTQAVSDCRKAGVFVRMITGDNLLTAKAIAHECGILTSGGIVMEGPSFRNLAPSQMDIVIPRLQVLARSSPQDKRTMVEHLKKLGETVAVTGDGTNDGPALRAADVGFSMGIAGTEVAKEASSIILMDDNFKSIVSAIAWGRCVNDSIKKFLQLTVSVVGVGITFVTGVVSTSESPSITPVQLLWVNLIQDTLGALALATDPPTLDLLNRLPESKAASMISFNMWKMIFGQSILQIAVILALIFTGRRIFESWTEDVMNTVVFNTFVWLQFFNEVNCRRLDNKLNVFYGIHRNPLFIIIMLIIIVGQIFIISFGGAAFSVTPLDGQQWLVSVLLGFLAILFGAIIRLIPNTFIQCLAPRTILSRQSQPVIVNGERQAHEWNEALEGIGDDLLFIKNLRNRKRLGNLGNRNRSNRPVPGSSNREELRSQHSNKSVKRSSSYSVFSSGTIFPALVATSITLPPVSPSDTQSAVASEEVGTFGGVEIYDESDLDNPVNV